MLYKIQIIILLLLLGFYGWSQNLIPNPSFEECRHQPTSMLDSGHEFERVTNFWSTANLASTDLITPRFRTPKFDAIPAHSGRNMAGIVIHGDFWSEYLKVPLRDTMVVGTEYYLEFWVAYNQAYHKKNLEANSNIGFGAYFGDRFFEKTNEIIERSPQIYLTESTTLLPNQWIKISGSYIADGEHTHLYIGQFLNPKSKHDILVGYFYIDDVRLEKFSDRSTIFTPQTSTPTGLENIYFETDKYDLLPQSHATLDRLVNYLQKNQSLQIQIHGHTDNEGEQYHNQELSNNRAKAVRDYLIQKGIALSRLQTKGFGDTKPIASNVDEYGRQQNRRVEFLASNELINNTNITKVDVAETDLVYTFSDQIASSDQNRKNNIGKYKSWDCNKGKQAKSPDRKAQEKLNRHKRVDAKSYILERSKSEQVVFFNDSNEHPQTRVFFQSLLSDFYRQGFRYLGIEALDYYDTSLNNRKYPSINSGEQTDEAVFGELIRTALRLGFEVFPYDAKAEELKRAKQIVQREKDILKDDDSIRQNALNWSQGMNINRRIKANPNAKILIYAKDKKIRENPLGGVRYMASWFQRYARINPLTIDQRMMNERCFAAEEPLYYTAKVGQSSVFTFNNKSLVLEEFDSQTNTPSVNYDIQVYHPRTKYEAGRPSYLQFDNKITHSINVDKYKMDYPCLVAAYYEQEDEEIAIPADIQEASSQKRTVQLILKRGKYTLLLRDKKQRKKVEIEVN